MWVLQPVKNPIVKKKSTNAEGLKNPPHPPKTKWSFAPNPEL